MSWLRFDFKVLAFLVFIWGISLFMTMFLPYYWGHLIVGIIAILVALYLWKSTTGIILIYKTNGYRTSDSQKVILVDDFEDIGDEKDEI